MGRFSKRIRMRVEHKHGFVFCIASFFANLKNLLYALLHRFRMQIQPRPKPKWIGDDHYTATYSDRRLNLMFK